MRSDYQKIDNLSEQDAALCQFAEHLTMKPGHSNDPQHVEALRQVGISDRAILDATVIIGYFNFVNRILMGLGMALKEDPGGFEYQVRH